ncbi:MAG: T9SS type A sorting domain-containing protein [Candidatus Eisenbacteria bacterium]|uniref:T9SS type A sorting domain-containing protein n=1 Tax=Eiseniibacteriota bacterium TaxID=2212470 RepID=A0A849SIR8_UNCEI|nr:T9SS type A sorting domain-containing protein [Candidatus Eisenbacteria bacterium]
MISAILMVHLAIVAAVSPPRAVARPRAAAAHETSPAFRLAVERLQRHRAEVVSRASLRSRADGLASSPEAAPPRAGLGEPLYIPGSPTDDVRWSGEFADVDLDGPIRDLASYRGGLAASGYFRIAGGVRCNGLAFWDGTTWSRFGVGAIPYPGALATVGDDLYVGAADDTTGGILIARWNGAAWTDRSENLAGAYVSTLFGWNGAVYAGGVFELQNGTRANLIRNAGAGWETIAGAPEGFVWDFESDGATLLVAGQLGASAEFDVPILMRWNTVGWDTLGRADGDRFAPLATTVAKLGSDTWVGGLFKSVDGVACDGLAYRTAAQWHGLVPEFGALIFAIVPDAGGIAIAGGLSQSVLLWNGSQFVSYGPGLYGSAATLASMNGRLSVGGSFTVDGQGTPVRFSAQWDGAHWSELRPAPRSGASGLTGTSNVRALLAFDGRLVAAGALMTGGPLLEDLHRPLALQWDGTRWSPLGTVEINGATEVLGIYRGELIAGGLMGLYTNPPWTGAVTRWDGEAWLPIANGPDRRVFALLEHGSDLIVGGDFGNVNHLLASGVAKWNGQSWTPMNARISIGPAPEIRALASYGDRVIAAGDFGDFDGAPLANIASWNGSAWSPLGAGLDGTVLALEVHGNDLYAAGMFLHAGGLDSPGIARWDGQEWHAVPGAPSPSVSDLRWSDGALYATGMWFIDGQATDQIARFDGQSWRGLGTGILPDDYYVSPQVSTLAEYDGDLFVGGYFMIAGGKSSKRIARWDLGGAPGVAPGQVAWRSSRPNPFADRVVLRFEVASPTRGSLRIFDLRGREVARPRDGEWPAGLAAVAWDGRDRDGRSLPSGLYFARLKLANGSESSTRLVLTR